MSWKQFQERRADEQQLREWWKRWPTANVGIVTGKVSGLVVVDADVKAGARGIESWDALREKLALVEVTPTSVTPTGGRHFLYMDSGCRVRNSAGKLGPGLDVRAEGGCIVAPPSRTAQGEYRWLAGLMPDQVAPPELPEALVELLVDPAADGGQGSAPPVEGRILKGERNSTLASLAGTMRRRGMTQKEIEAALQVANNDRCTPPLDESDVLRIAMSVGRYEPQAKQGERDTQTMKILDIAARAHLIRARGPDETAYAVIEKEAYPIDSKALSHWLQREYRKDTGRPVATTSLKSALDALMAEAASDDTPVLDVGLRVLRGDGCVYLDLADDDRHVVVIDAEGWRVTTDAEAIFYRPRTMLPLPVPERGGSIDQLFRLVNVAEEDEVLLVGWLLGAFHPRGPYPLLSVRGGQGSGKTLMCNVIRRLIDPALPATRAIPDGERDLVISARGNWVLVYDNVSGLSSRMADAMCRMATGSGLGTRALYTNSEEMVFHARRPIVLNSIPDVLERDDLRDRALAIELSAISSDKRRTEMQLERMFEAVHPRLLGVLLDGVSAALRYYGQASRTLEGRMPRMADHAVWVYAAMEAFPWSGDEWLAVYEAAANAELARALSEDPIAVAIIGMRTKGELPWKGTATELLKHLELNTLANYRSGSTWPKNPRALSERLSRLEVSLASEGIVVSKGKGQGSRVIQITEDEAHPRVKLLKPVTEAGN